MAGIIRSRLVGRVPERVKYNTYTIPHVQIKSHSVNPMPRSSYAEMDIDFVRFNNGNVYLGMCCNDSIQETTAMDVSCYGGVEVVLEIVDPNGVVIFSASQQSGGSEKINFSIPTVVDSDGEHALPPGWMIRGMHR